MIPTVERAAIPSITTKQMIEVDRAMIDDYGIDLTRMMENAGRNLAHLARERFLDGDPTGRRVAVLAGPGGNGGGALVAARRLRNYGAEVTVLVTKPDEAMSPALQEQLAIVRRMGIPVGAPGDVGRARKPDVILDGLLGYSLHGAPRGMAADLIEWANGRSARILALDVPSGLDATTGIVLDPAIRASATMTLALSKAGLENPCAASVVGDLYLADISVPPDLYERVLGIEVGPIFAASDIVQLT
jgi:NAD(P)H-hydrate epimerase